MPTRLVLRYTLVAAVTALSFAAVPADAQSKAAGTRTQKAATKPPTDRAAARAHAIELLAASPLVDGHNDLPWAIREQKGMERDVDAYDLRKKTPHQTDLARIRAGKLGGQFWSVYIPGDIKDSGYARVQLEQIDIARRVVAKYPETFVMASTAAEMRAAFKKGRVGTTLGMEGGHAIENSLGALRAYYDLGARYMTLTHNVTLDWADAALDSAKHKGLTPFGKEVVREMNRLGMLVDLSHVSPGVMSNALDVTESPVIFSHSSAKAIVDHPRNVPDSILKRLPKNGGVVMVTFVPSFDSPAVRAHGLQRGREQEAARQGLRNDTAKVNDAMKRWDAAHPAPKATLADVANMIDHIKKTASADNVGIGSDFDGVDDDLPEGLQDISNFPDLFAELIMRGWSDTDLKKLAGENVLRALERAETVAKRLQRERGPSTKTIEETLEIARRQFLSTARGTLEAFDQLSAQLAVQPTAEQLLTPLRRELHRLNGSAATFGFPRLGRMAAALEGAVKKWAADPALDRDRRAPIVARFARALREELAGDSAAPTLAGRRLLVVGLRDAVAIPLITEASSRAYLVERVTADELEEAVEEGNPAGIIASDQVRGVENFSGIARLYLRKREEGEPEFQTSIRVLDVRTEATEVLDALDAISNFEREASGRLIAVDDDPVMRTIIRVAAEHMNLTVTTAANPSEMRAAVAESAPSIFVVDIDLGTANGLDIVRELRANPANASTPVLMLSGHADVATRDAAFGAGADDYMLKPFAPAEFQRRVLGLVDATRRKLATTGMHATARVSLPSRTLRDFDSHLSTVAGDRCLAVVAPTEAPPSVKETAAWHRECGRLAEAALAEGGRAGLVDELTLGLILVGNSLTNVAWLTAQAGLSPGGTPAWTAGVIAADAQNTTLLSRLALAREARNAAREGRVPACEWNANDADVAPDVIVVEDDSALADLIVFALETKGLTYNRYADGLSALDGLRKMRVNATRSIVLLDIDLPGLDGHSIHERLRVERPGKFDIVFLSVHTSEAEQLRALQSGALDYLTKPVSLRILAAKLAGWRGRAGEG
jgi:membrane dipeptidase